MFLHTGTNKLERLKNTWRDMQYAISTSDPETLEEPLLERNFASQPTDQADQQIMEDQVNEQHNTR